MNDILTTKHLDEKIGGIVHQFKENRKSLEEKYDGLLEESQKKMAIALTDLADQKQKTEQLQQENKQYQQQVDQLDACIKRGFTNDGSVAQQDDAQEIQKSYDFWLGKGSFAGKAEATLKTLREASDPDGGFLVRPAFVNRIISKVFDTSPVRPFANVITSALPVPFITDLGQITSGWVSELGSRTAGATPQFGEIMLDPKEHYAIVEASQRLLDSVSSSTIGSAGSLDLETWIANRAAEKFSRLENTAFVNGDGVGKPKGLLSTAYTFTTSYTDHTDGTVEMINSGSNGAFTVDGLMDLIGALKPEYAQNARLYVHRKGFYELLQLKSTDNYHLVDPLTLFFGSNDMQRQGPLIPVTFWNDLTAPASYTTGTKAAIYGDIGQAYQIVDGKALTLLRDPYSAKPKVQFYFHKRVDGGVVNFDAYKVQQLSS